MRINVLSSGQYNIFNDLYISLKASLEDLGHKVQIFHKENQPGPFNIYILGNINGFDIPKNSLNILYLVEQKSWKNYGKIRKKFDYVLDMFQNNYEKYNSDNSFLCPMGYSSALSGKMSFSVSKDYFLLGGSTKYRRKRVKEKGLRLSGGIYNKNRDVEILKSKINLMFKAYERYSLPLLHSSIILSKGKFLMVDKHNSYYPLEVDKHLVLYNKKSFGWWLKHDKEREDFEKNALEDYKENHNFTDYLGEALSKIKEIK